MSFKALFARCFIFSCFYFLITPAFTEEKLKSKFRHYSTEDGLSHDGVLCMTRDKEGFMWFGTWDGINRFDGNNFVTYKAKPGDNSSLKNNKIRNIVEDKFGYLWIKTYDNRVYRFDKSTENFSAITKTINGENLSNISIDRIIHTRLGDVWLITEDQGLISAGYNNGETNPVIQIFNYGKQGEFYLPSNLVNFVFEDSQNHIWVLTEKGLVSFFKKKDNYQQHLNFRSGSKVFLPGSNFTCADGAKEKIYFGTSDGKIIIYDIQQRVFKIKTLEGRPNINAVKVAKSGLIYITTIDKGLVILNPKTLGLEYMNASNALFSIYEDKPGNIWLEPAYNGIIKYNPLDKTFKNYYQKKEKNIPESMQIKGSQDKRFTVFEDIHGVLWASLKGGGFGYYNKTADQISYLYNEPGAANQQLSNEVVSAYSDPTGVLWLSTRFGGIHKFIFPANNFLHQQLVPDSKNRYDNEVRALYEDSQQRIWMSTKIGQLYVFKGRKRISDKELLINITSDKIGSVYTIRETKDGEIWLGTKGQGLVVLTPQDKKRTKYVANRYLESVNDKNSISSNMIYSILEDKKGRTWIGTFGGGLNEAVKTKSRLQFKHSNNFYKNYPIKTCNVIRHIQEGHNGIIWVGTTDGLLRFEPMEGARTKFHRSQKIPGVEKSLGNNDVQFIHMDKLKHMWLGTFGGGLNKVIGQPGLNDKLTFSVYTKEQGLPNDIVLNIIDDDNGNLWMATENGLSKFNLKQNTFRNFDSFEGLPKSGFSEAASFKSASGALYFGCINGYVSFFPSKVTSKKFKANLALTNLQLYNNDVIVGEAESPLTNSLNYTKELKLAYDQNVMNIDYSVLDYRTSHNFSYAYMLEGYDKDWHYVKNQKKASYTRLPHGKYIFKVKSLNQDLFQNIPEKSIAITILPPPWLTTWAFIIYLIIAIVVFLIARNIIITMIKLRNKVEVEHKLTELKLQFFTNISHELRTPLTLIVNPLRQIALAENLSVKGREYIMVVNKNANRMVRFINQLLDFRKIQSGKIQLKVTEIEIVGFVKDMAAYFNELAEEKNIKFQIHADVEEHFTWLDEEKMDIVIYNLLSNAFKFTPAGKSIIIEINCESDADNFTIKITDQGIGVPENKLAEIFELYYEGENHDHSQKGTGIGLALSKEIVQSHKGKITAGNNAEGMYFLLTLKKGNDHFLLTDLVKEKITEKHNFSYDLDDTAGVVTTNERISAPGNLINKSTVLLVEDNRDLRGFLADQLNDIYQVLQAADGEQGLAVAKAKLPDLIISDVMMPNMDGIAMLESLKNDLTTSHIPVILLTAKSSVENQINGLKYGADFYITKPFHIDHILASMENLIKQRKNLYNAYSGGKKTIKLEPGEIVITSKDEKFLKEIIIIVEESMANPQFNIDSVAAAIGMGRTTFYKKLKGLTNMSPVEFVRDMRLKRGKQLMDAGENTISEIAYMVGFSSSGYFSTCFKEEYKISPSDYLKK